MFKITKIKPKKLETTDTFTNTQFQMFNLKASMHICHTAYHIFLLMKALNTMWMILNDKLHMLLNLAPMLSKEYTCLTYQVMQRCILDQKHSQNKVSVYAQKKEQASLAPFFLSFTILPFSGYHGVSVHI